MLSRRSIIFGGATALALPGPSLGRLLHSGTPFYEGLIASRARMFTQTDTTTNKQIMGRSAHIAAQSITALKIAFGNFNGIAVPADQGLGGTITLTAGIEYPAGTFTRVTFSGGSTSATVASNGVVFSDFISIAGGIPNGATFWVRMYATSATGILYNNWQNTFLGEATAVGASGVVDKTISGTITDTGQGWSFPPLAVLGQTSNPSVIIVGDSIGFGTNDTEDASSSATGFNAKIGLVARSLGSVPFLNLSRPAMQATGWASNCPASQQLVPKGSHLVTQIGTNDIFNGRSSAQLTTDLQSIWSLKRSRQKVFQCTLLPRDTDPGTPQPAFTTLGQQTPADATVYNTFNDAVKAGLSGAAGFYDTCSVFESSLHSRLWLVTPSPPYTADGTHPNTTGYAMVPASGVIPLPTWP